MTRQFDTQDILLTRDEAAAMLRIKPQTLAKWACNKTYTLPLVKVGSRAMYRLIDLRDFQTRNLQGAEPQGGC